MVILDPSETKLLAGGSRRGMRLKGVVDKKEKRFRVSL